MSNPKFITIAKESLPSRKFAVNLARPTFQEYSRAWKLFPAESPQNPDGPGYTFEDFFCALCILKPDGTEPDDRPKDAIHRFDDLELKDKQFIVNTFVSAFMLGQDLQDEAEVLADQLLNIDPQGLAYTLQKKDLPLQSLDVTFNRPSSSVQLYTNKNFTSNNVNGCQFSDLLFLTCVSHINGVEVSNPKNVVNIVYDFDLLDIQYASAVFLSMFALDMKGRQKSTELGKSLRDSLLSPSPSPSPKNPSGAKGSADS